MVLTSPHLSETITRRRTVGGVNAYGEFVEGSPEEISIRAVVEPIADERTPLEEGLRRETRWRVYTREHLQAITQDSRETSWKSGAAGIGSLGWTTTRHHGRLTTKPRRCYRHELVHPPARARGNGKAPSQIRLSTPSSNRPPLGLLLARPRRLRWRRQRACWGVRLRLPRCHLIMR